MWPILTVALLAWATLGGIPAGQAQERPYRIGPKDVVKITVFGQEDLSRSAVVSADGTVQLPLIGDVPASGLTPGELEGRLRDLLGKDYLVDPKVSVSVQEYRSQRVFVLGEAERPGTYALTGQTTLVDVLSQAGGPAKTASRQVVVVRSPKSDGPVVPGAAGTTTLRVSLQRLMDGVAGENLLLENGDTVFIPKLASYFVQGEVRKPGAYPLEKDTNLLEAVTLAGGFSERAAPGGAKLIRRKADGTPETRDVNLSGGDPRARETLLGEGDTLVVPAGNITFYVLGEVKKPGAYQLDQASTALEGVALAGGFTDKAAPARTRVIRTHKDGRQETLQIDLNEIMKRGRKDKDVPLTANDVIVVPESFF